MDNSGLSISPRTPMKISRPWPLHMTKQTLIALTSGQELAIGLSYPAKKLPKRSFSERTMSKTTNPKVRSWKNRRQATLRPHARSRWRTKFRKHSLKFGIEPVPFQLNVDLIIALEDILVSEPSLSEGLSPPCWGQEYCFVFKREKHRPSGRTPRISNSKPLWSPKASLMKPQDIVHSTGALPTSGDKARVILHREQGKLIRIE